MQPSVFRKTWLIVLVLVLGLFLATAVTSLAGTPQSPDLSFDQVKETVAPPPQVDSVDVPSADTVGDNFDLIEPEKAILEEPARFPARSGISAPSVLLYDNGPVSSSFGTGVGGVDESILQNNSLGMSNMGFQHRQELGYWVADDFTVSDAQGWTIEAIVFFAYQPDSTTSSTMDDVRLRIWDGPPGAGSSVVWGDTTTNQLDDTMWSNIYRVNEDTSGSDSSRPVMYNIVVINHFLPQGTYWLDWQAGGTLALGPYTPPLTINGISTTGNGLWSTDGGVTYAAALDRGTSTQQGFPFVIHGSVGPPPVASISLEKTVGLNPTLCSTTDTISVFPGTEVTYCYEVTNTGTISLDRHDVVDTQLGELLSNFAHTLIPGANGWFTYTTEIQSSIINTATWTAYNSGPTDVAQATDTALVIVSADDLVCNGELVEFEFGIPSTFRTIANGPVYWSTTDDLDACDNGGNQTAGFGNAACADGDETNLGGDPYDAELWTNAIDLTGPYADALLHFDAAYNDIVSDLDSDMFDVDASTDGGATWTTLLSWNEDHYNPSEAVTLNLSDYLGEPAVIVRFRYYGTVWPWWAHVDQLGLTCTNGNNLTVAKGGSGSGKVTSDPAGIDCGTACDAIFAVSTPVTLTTNADIGSIFSGWGGACSGQDECVVMMENDRAVTASFSLEQFQLSVSQAGTGRGTVTSDPVGINCGTDCDEMFLFGTMVTLTAAADGVSTFSGWSGACSGVGECTLTMDSDQMVSATFLKNIQKIYLPLQVKNTP